MWIKCTIMWTQPQQLETKRVYFITWSRITSSQIQILLKFYRRLFILVQLVAQLLNNTLKKLLRLDCLAFSNQEKIPTEVTVLLFIPNGLPFARRLQQLALQVDQQRSPRNILAHFCIEAGNLTLEFGCFGMADRPGGIDRATSEQAQRSFI